MEILRHLIGDDATALLLCASGLGAGLVLLKLAGWFRAAEGLDARSDDVWQLPADLLPKVPSEAVQVQNHGWQEKAA
ncbi:hypothetical protein Plim_2511 [Planctopirus limnophila DSM 3776]|uniref:Uncharacterized protein n=1 Tax=Planctopirus limnophila (strain ATCC 43296 / DSM 3776 / IFAM 1008 / Mu 290) TaxID=521674 RepID=D5SPW2_PLAL2|nr:hypothetical protein [Planctopirus limnophila]ADG68337.1 hypothetical protein Plim_2511 [Planctopirus limnophila DSM 3776]